MRYTLTLVPLLSFALIGCGGKSEKSDDLSPPVDLNPQAITDDITKTELPSFVGLYQSPAGDLRIDHQGRFTLEVAEDGRWYAQDSSDSTQYYAKCRIRRIGDVRIHRKNGLKLLRFEMTDRTLIEAKKDSRTESPDPTAICEKILSIYATSASQYYPLEFEVVEAPVNQSPKSFWLRTPLKEKTDTWEWNRMETSNSTTKLHADSDVRGTFAFVFTPKEATVDVTELVESGLANRKIEGVTYDGRVIRVYIDPAFKTLRYTDSACPLDLKISYRVVSNGTELALQNPKGTETAPEAYRVRAEPCVDKRFLLERSKADLLILNDLQDIRGHEVLRSSFRLNPKL